MIPPIESTEFDEFVKPYITEEKKVDLKSVSVDHAACMKLHAEGKADNPKLRELLDRRRPNESTAVKEHRLANFRPITKAEFERIENTLHTIYNPRNFNIKWPEMRAMKENTIEQYFTESFPKYGSLVKYWEQSVFHNDLVDVNGILLIMPFVEPNQEPGLIKPFPYFIECCEIIERTDELLAITQDKHFILVDKEVAIKGIRREEKGEVKYDWTVIFEHNLGILPVVDMPEVEKSNDSIFGERSIKESYVSGILPYFDKAIMNDTDRDAVQVRFAHPKEWEWKTNCPECKGMGRVAMSGLKENGFRPCSVCHGTGSMIGDSPADKFRLDPKYMADNNIAGPPFGFEHPSAEILADIRLSVRENIEDGFGALNMHQLSRDNTGESGIAKVYGREDLNTLMLTIARGNWDAYFQTVTISSMIRYGPAGQFVADEMPDITYPLEFDMSTSAELTNKVKAAKDAGMDPNYLKLLTIQTAKKDFGDTSAEALFFVALQEIDPFPNSTPDDLLTFQGSIKAIDRVVHANINNLMNLAMLQNEGFLYLDRSDQREIIYKLGEGMTADLKKEAAMIPAPDPNEPPIE